MEKKNAIGVVVGLTKALVSEFPGGSFATETLGLLSNGYNNRMNKTLDTLAKGLENISDDKREAYNKRLLADPELAERDAMYVVNKMRALYEEFKPPLFVRLYCCYVQCNLTHEDFMVLTEMLQKLKQRDISGILWYAYNGGIGGVNRHDPSLDRLYMDGFIEPSEKESKEISDSLRGQIVVRPGMADKEVIEPSPWYVLTKYGKLLYELCDFDTFAKQMFASESKRLKEVSGGGINDDKQ